MPLLGVCFCSSKRDRFFIFAALPVCKCNRFPLCLCLVVALQFQAKQLLNLCRFAWLECNRFPFVPLSVWSFNLHQKRNSVTASLSFAALPVWCAIDFLCAFVWLWLCSSKRNSFLIFAALWVCLFGALIYIKNETA